MKPSVSGVKPVFWWDSRLKGLGQSTTVSINNSAEGQREWFSYRAAELGPSKIISPWSSSNQYLGGCRLCVRSGCKLSILRRRLGQRLCFQSPRPLPAVVRPLAVGGQSPVPAPGRCDPALSSAAAASPGSGNSCPAEGAQLEDARRRVAEEGSRDGGLALHSVKGPHPSAEELRESRLGFCLGFIYFNTSIYFIL